MSSDTFAILAIASTSVSFNFGLLSTAAPTILFGSRTSTARSSRDPFIASDIRCATFKLAIFVTVDSRI